MANRMNNWYFRQWTEGWTRNDLTQQQVNHIEAAKAWDHALTAAKVHREFDGTAMGNRGSSLELAAFNNAYRLGRRAVRQTPKSDLEFNAAELKKLLKLGESGLMTFYQVPRRALLAYKRLRDFHMNQVRLTDDQKYKDDIAWRIKCGVVPIGPPPIWESKIDYVEGVDPERFTIRRDENTKAYILEDKVKGREIRRFNWLPTRWDIDAIMEFYKTN